MKIKLPDDGHTWKEVPSGNSALTVFACECGATFIVDLIDDSTEYDEGEGHCEDEE